MAHIQVRNIPEALHRRLKARAALEGVSMSQYVMWQIERSLARPSRRETLDAIRREPPLIPGPGACGCPPRGAGRALMVLDASAAVELLLNTPSGRRVSSR